MKAVEEILTGLTDNQLMMFIRMFYRDSRHKEVYQMCSDILDERLLTIKY